MEPATKGKAYLKELCKKRIPQLSDILEEVPVRLFNEIDPEHSEISPGTLLCVAFIWRTSPQGESYWRKQALEIP